MYHFTIRIMLIIFSFLVFQNTLAETYYVDCSEQNGCIQKIQKKIDDYRLKNKLIGVQASISLPSKYNDLQPMITLRSGYTTKERIYSVGTAMLIQPGKKMDLFGDGSITKSFTSSIILQLEAEGLLKLDDTVGKYLPQYKAWKNITIRQLLNMTSGIFDYTDNPDFWQQEVASPEKEWIPQELIEFSYTNQNSATHCTNGGNLCFAPGTNWMYSNTNYILAEMIIESVTGKNFRDVINERLIGKNSTLGQLENTYYFDSKNTLSSHFFPFNIWQRAVHSYYPLQAIIDPSQRYRENDLTDMNLSYAAAAGANISNSEDLIKWTRLLFQTNQVLLLPQQQELNSFICTDHQSSLYAQPIAEVNSACKAGFGLGVGEVLDETDGLERSFDGSDPGYNSYYVLFEKYNIDISAQGDGVNSIDKLPYEILTILKSYH